MRRERRERERVRGGGDTTLPHLLVHPRERQFGERGREWGEGATQHYRTSSCARVSSSFVVRKLSLAVFKLLSEVRQWSQCSVADTVLRNCFGWG